MAPPGFGQFSTNFVPLTSPFPSTLTDNFVIGRDVNGRSVGDHGSDGRDRCTESMSGLATCQFGVWSCVTPPTVLRTSRQGAVGSPRYRSAGLLTANAKPGTEVPQSSAGATTRAPGEAWVTQPPPGLPALAPNDRCSIQRQAQRIRKELRHLAARDRELRLERPVGETVDEPACPEVVRMTAVRS